MNPTIKNLSVLLLAGVLCVGRTQATVADLSAESSTQLSEWTLSYKNQKLLVYSFSPQKYKPYIKELHTLAGDNILRDAPSDHLHHHALMYAIKVNGLNFWEETPGNGVQKVIQTSKPQTGASAEGLPQATIQQVIHWVAPDDAFLPDTAASALLIEKRTLILTVNESAHEVALHWKSSFEVGKKAGEVVLSGANYHGLGMRFSESLDPVAAHVNSGGRPDLSGSKQDVSPHRWGAVMFDAAGRPATVALFGHPANRAGDAQFFSMRTPFAYLSATQGLDKAPLTYRSGDKFEMNYLVALYSELKAADFLDKRAEQWSTLKP